ncbi:MAG: hypothetical protein A3G18_03200 [Rhodospirillales bacterium RIFCSPLOWO2_12_FULL_58_28]|nr:MAG: hypothetical protein A3H92_03145 [Rhodospirillales bacterium RIFCSPLOWO2_02_FULL_58_16]OHC77284.1 MAG: hypothetical protein A3G18_03200 [Rhodospirillales bacterium RIFCSPLOWO2_12_FULL_58_28]
MRGPEQKRRAWRYGRFAETLCVWSLRLRGYRILERDFRVHAGEIDIIARRGRIIAMIEVKARRDMGEAAHALGLRQRRRIAAAAGAFLRSRPEYAGLDARFDVMLVSPGRLPTHLTGAWICGD